MDVEHLLVTIVGFVVVFIERQIASSGILNRQLIQPSCSEIEGKLVKVDIRRDVADFAAIDSDLVGKHARCGNLNRIWPVVVVVAKRVGEVKDCVFRDERGVLCNVEVGRFNSTLGD